MEPGKLLERYHSYLAHLASKHSSRHQSEIANTYVSGRASPIFELPNLKHYRQSTNTPSKSKPFNSTIDLND